MKLVEYVPEYVLRDLQLKDGRKGIKVGMTVTILTGARVNCSVPSRNDQQSWGVMLTNDLEVALVNFLPGHTDVYADRDGKFAVHNHQVVWKANILDEDVYYSTDINNVQEVRDAP